jgi:hypothetical protein
MVWHKYWSKICASIVARGNVPTAAPEGRMKGVEHANPCLIILYLWKYDTSSMYRNTCPLDYIGDLVCMLCNGYVSANCLVYGFQVFHMVLNVLLFCTQKKKKKKSSIWCGMHAEMLDFQKIFLKRFAGGHGLHLHHYEGLGFSWTYLTTVECNKFQLSL